jgi:uncharacterized GH25 family protein
MQQPTITFEASKDKPGFVNIIMEHDGVRLVRTEHQTPVNSLIANIFYACQDANKLEKESNDKT